MNPILMTEQDLIGNPMLNAMGSPDQILQQIEPVAMDMPIEDLGAIPMPPKPPIDMQMIPAQGDIMGGIEQGSAMPMAQPMPAQDPRGFFQQIGDYAKNNAGELLSRGINQINENYMTDNMSVENYLKYQNVKNEKEIANKKNVLDSLALEQDMRYKTQDLEVKRENLAQQRMILMSQLSGQNISNMIGMRQLGVRVNPETGETTYVEPRPETTATQDLARGFANRVAEALPIIDKFEEAGTSATQEALSSVPFAGNKLVSPEFQQLDQAKRNFVNAVLRRESGAVISPEEFKNAEIQYFPQPFDSKEVLKQKEQNRMTALENLSFDAGAGYAPPQSSLPTQDNDPLGIR